MTPLLLRLAILVTLFAMVFLVANLVVGTMVNRRAARKAVNRRMALLRSGLDREAVGGALLKNAPRVLMPNASVWERAQVGLSRLLMTSGIRLELRTFVIAMAVTGVGLFALLLGLSSWAHFQLTGGVILLVGAVAGSIGAGLPLMMISRLGEKRKSRIRDQFPSALDIFVRSLRAGHPVAAAMDLITQEMEDPIGSEFGLVADEVAFGADLTDALLGMAERWGSEDLRMFVVCVSVQSETGGNLAEILENLAHVIRERANMYLKVRALSSEGRMTGWMLSALPVLAFTVLFFYNPAFYLDVAQDRIFMIGFPALMALYAVGVLSIRKMVDLKV